MTTADTTTTAATLHRLTANDVKYCDNRDRAPYSALQHTFNSNTDKHQMTVLLDEGLYRHLRFKDPHSPFYWFDLITWPGFLTVTGDMGTYTFARLRDMFEFFTGYINSDYWAEKLQNGTSGGRQQVKDHDAELFRKWALEDFWKASREEEPLRAKVWWSSLRADVLDPYSGADLDTTHGCLDALNSVDPEFRGHYQDAWELDWTRYELQFEFCLAAIVTGIRTYKTYTAHQ